MESPPRSSNRKAATSAQEGLIDRALALYQPRTRRELTREDGREMVHNLAGFLSVLAGWKRRELANAAPIPPSPGGAP